MKPPKKRERFISEKYPTLCGYRDPSTDYFTDVSRALSRWLLDNDRQYRRSSDLAKDRHVRINERSMA